MVTGSAIGVRTAVGISRIGQMIREQSIRTTTPWAAKVAVQTAEAIAEQRAKAARDGLVGWLEEHASDSPLPLPVGSLFGALGRLGGFLVQNVFGTAIGFGVGGALSGVLEPYFVQMQQSAWRSNPVAVLSPPELALAVLRGFLDQPAAEAEAKSSGIDSARFQTMLDNTGEPLGGEQLLEAYRRNIIDKARLERGIRESRVRNEWIDVAEALRYGPPSPAEAIAGVVEGHLDETKGRDIFQQGGLSPEHFDWMFETAGRPPGAAQMAELFNRRLITEQQFRTAIRESDIKNKYIDAIVATHVYLPPPRSVPVLYRNGAITRQRAVDLLKQYGVTDQDAAAYVDSASATKSQATKDLTVSEISSLYSDQAIAKAEAVTMLEALGYDPHESDWITSLVDLQRERRFFEAFVGKIHSLFVAHRITEEDAQKALDKEHVPADQKAYLLNLWHLEREANVLTLTNAELAAAFHNGLLTADAYGQELTDRGMAHADVKLLQALHAPPGEAPPAPRRLTVGQVTSAYRKGIITRDDALTDLEALGYEPTTAGVILDTAVPPPTGGG